MTRRTNFQMTNNKKPKIIKKSDIERAGWG